MSVWSNVWEKTESILDVAVDAAAEGYVKSKTPAPQPQPTQDFPEQTVSRTAADKSDRPMTALERTARAIEPYRDMLPWALVALVGLWLFVRRGR